MECGREMAGTTGRYFHGLVRQHKVEVKGIGS